MSGGDYPAVGDTAEDQLKAATDSMYYLRKEVAELHAEMGEKDTRILELSADLHTYDAIAGKGARADGAALRKRIETLEEFVKKSGCLHTCASNNVKHRHNHFCGGGPIYHDCDCGYADLMIKVK